MDQRVDHVLRLSAQRYFQFTVSLPVLDFDHLNHRHLNLPFVDPPHSLREITVVPPEQPVPTVLDPTARAPRRGCRQDASAASDQPASPSAIRLPTTSDSRRVCAAVETAAE